MGALVTVGLEHTTKGKLWHLMSSTMHALRARLGRLQFRVVELLVLHTCIRLIQEARWLAGTKSMPR